MNDMGAGIIERYDLAVNKIIRGRGALILETNQGLKRLMPYVGTMSRLVYLDRLLVHIRLNGFKNVDYIIRNKEEELYSEDDAGDKYILTEWYQGSECDVKSIHNICEGAAILGRLHCKMQNFTEGQDDDEVSVPEVYNVVSEYEKHNNELRRAKRYIRARKHKSRFEFDVLSNIDKYLEYGEESLDILKNSKYEELEKEAFSEGRVCHGNYNYHNILLHKNWSAIVNFEKSARGVQIKDLYLYMRKVMEKYDWNESVGHNILESYNKERVLSLTEYDVLKKMLIYPEKFWKLVNQYYNGNKAWLPEKSMKKLETVNLQLSLKDKFIESM